MSIKNKILDLIEKGLDFFLYQIRKGREEQKYSGLPILEISEKIHYCKKCRKPFTRFLMDGEVLKHSKFSELHELCSDCTPIGVKEEVNRHYQRYMEACNKAMGKLKGEES